MHKKQISDVKILEYLPDLRGRLTSDAPIGHMTWLRVGGNAEYLFKPKDMDDLVYFLRNCPKDIAVTTIGVASNLIIRDGGIKGVVIKLGKGFSDITVENDVIMAGAAALDMNVALVSAREELSGFEFLSGIPGTIGGALRMNAGAYGSEIADILISATAIDRQGNIHELTTDNMVMTYRHNNASEDFIFTQCKLKATGQQSSEILEQRIAEIKEKRQESQPIREKTGGSTFANPSQENKNITVKAWELIDEAGCRGLMVGGAQMSEKHCNFMINTGNATAKDLEDLGEEVRCRVLENSGIDLRWEIKRLGKKS